MRTWSARRSAWMFPSLVAAVALLATAPAGAMRFAQTAEPSQTSRGDEPTEDKRPEQSTEDDPPAARGEVKESITVFGEGVEETDYTSPKSLLTSQDLEPIAVVTTEDIVKYEPSLVIRRRFIGDANGTMGIRGSNMFQTTRSMVFADGIPLHYFLETRWNGSPRWGLVNADEVGFVEVVYGPFSAEYSGNAMGGVVNIETKIPTERHVHFEGMLINQDFDALGVGDDSLDGFRGFLSYGDRIGGFSFYGAMTRLENHGQTQAFLFDTQGVPSGEEVPVRGSLSGRDEYGEGARYFGNAGPVDSLTDQFKLKLGYEFGDGWLALLNTGYEVRNLETDAAENYLVGLDGQPVWSGRVVEDGVAFDVSGSDFLVDVQDRRTLLLGLRLSGPLNDRWSLQAALSSFDILEDEARASLRNPADPAYTPTGTVRDNDDASWQSADVKLQNDALGGNDALSLVTGYRWETYSLGVSNYDSDDYASGARSALNNASGGDSELHALFAQLGWRLGSRWDLALGGRYEDWATDDGFFNDLGEVEHHVDRAEERFSPKFSLGFAPSAGWRLRLSAAKAYRFPIVEELFQNERSTNGTSIANADLEPEDGRHLNWMVERYLSAGVLRLNVFTETIEDTIEGQSTIVDNRTIRTFLPIDEVETHGVELIYGRSRIGDSRLGARFNVTYLDSEIIENRADPSLEGKVYPRMPRWRANLLLDYALAARWQLGGGVRYSSDSYGDLDNADTAREVFGAIDAYTQLNLKVGYRLNEMVRFNLAVDNLTDEITYVHHPWPGRTASLEVVIDR
ncbi:MAG: TonB-dependent receptor [Thermoanaerobaculia bacterium]